MNVVIILKRGVCSLLCISGVCCQYILFSVAQQSWGELVWVSGVSSMKNVYEGAHFPGNFSWNQCGISRRGGKNSEKCRVFRSCWWSSDALILTEFYQERFDFRPEEPSSLLVWIFSLWNQLNTLPLISTQFPSSSSVFFSLSVLHIRMKGRSAQIIKQNFSIILRN